MPHQKRSRSLRLLLEQLQCRFRDDEVTALSAQLTYYLILSFFPFLIFVVTILGFTALSQADLLDSISQLLPEASHDIVSGMLGEIQTGGSGALLSFGMVATLWAASNGINAVIKGLNRAYNEEESRPFWKVRGISLLSTLVLVLILVVSLLTLVFGGVISQQLEASFGVRGIITMTWAIGKYVLPLLIITAVFLLLYKIAPNRRIRFKEVVPGALFATFGWLVTSLAFSFYVSQFGNYTRTYGSLAGIIILLIWLYLSSIIILLGGQLNAALADLREGRLRKPNKSFGFSLAFLKRKKTQ